MFGSAPFFQQLFHPLHIASGGGFVEVGLVHGVFCAVFNILVLLSGIL
jgi:hypothetical protein